MEFNNFSLLVVADNKGKSLSGASFEAYEGDERSSLTPHMKGSWLAAKLINGGVKLPYLFMPDAVNDPGFGPKLKQILTGLGIKGVNILVICDGNPDGEHSFAPALEQMMDLFVADAARSADANKLCLMAYCSPKCTASDADTLANMQTVVADKTWANQVVCCHNQDRATVARKLAESAAKKIASDLEESRKAVQKTLDPLLQKPDEAVVKREKVSAAKKPVATHGEDLYAGASCFLGMDSMENFLGSLKPTEGAAAASGKGFFGGFKFAGTKEPVQPAAVAETAAAAASVVGGGVFGRANPLHASPSKVTNSPQKSNKRKADF